MEFLKRIYYRINPPKPYDPKEISNSIADRIRAGGGKVGKNFDIYETRIDLTNPYLISIGDDVTITSSYVLTHDASLHKKTGYSKVGKIKIGNNVFIGYCSIILPGVTIGNNVVVGAGTVVSKDIPDNVVVVGNPPKVLYTYEEFLKKNLLLMDSHPVINKYPGEIMQDKDSINQLLNSDIGYIF